MVGNHEFFGAKIVQVEYNTKIFFFIVKTQPIFAFFGSKDNAFH